MALGCVVGGAAVVAIGGGTVVAGTVAVGSAVLVGICVGLWLGIGVGLIITGSVDVGIVFAATAIETTSSFPMSPLNSAASSGTHRDTVCPGMRTCSQRLSWLRPTTV